MLASPTLTEESISIKGEVDKKLPIIITVLTIFIIVLVTVIIIPFIQIANEGVNPSLGLLFFIYRTSSEALMSVIWNLAISVVFAFIGIGGVIQKIKAELANEEMANMNGTVANEESDIKPFING